MSDRPLDSNEELLWRSLLRIVVTLPRLLDEDLVRATGVSLSEYVILMNLSEARDRELRLTDLANAAALSLSRVSRIVDDMVSRGLVAKRRATGDTRGAIATLTPAGLERLVRTYPDHLRSARRRVMDHIDPAVKAQTAAVLAAVVEGLTSNPPLAAPKSAG
jgi:DNA-binding MarR family transcriptional regulator